MSKKKYNLDDFLLKHEISTRWKDLDAFGHVNNAWKSLTNHGNYPRPKADNMEKFYNFICDLISVPESDSEANSKSAAAN